VSPDTVSLGGVAHEVALRMPTIGETHSFVRDPSLHRDEATLREVARLQVFDAFTTVDGRETTMDAAAALVAEPGDRAALLTLRNASIAEAMATGTVEIACPSCPQGRWGGRLAELAAAVGAAPGSLGDADGELAPFALSYAVAALPAGGATVGFVLPGGGAGVLGELDALAEAAGWLRWAPVGRAPAEGQEDRVFESAGFRAVLRMTCALQSLDGSDAVSVDDVERLSLAAFCFLDELYRLLFLDERSVGGACPLHRRPS
jgi:hypothetical protein